MQSTVDINYTHANTGELTDVSTSATVDGLTNGTTYYFKLIVNISGHEVISNKVSCKPGDALSGPTGDPLINTIPFLTKARTKVMIGYDDWRLYAFNPSDTGEYIIYTEDPARDTYVGIFKKNELVVYLFDCEWIGDHDDEDVGNNLWNFKCVLTLEEGNTYYLGIYDYNDNEPIDLCISGPGMDPNAPVDGIPPVPGNSGIITTANITQNSVDLSWSAANDDVTAPADLQYKVVRSTSNNLDTVSNTESNGTVVQDWQANLISKQVTGLKAGTTYYFNVIVKDEAGNKALYTTVSQNTLAIPAQTATATAITTTPAVGVNNAITLTVKDSVGNVDTDFSGAKDVIITGVEAAPNGTYGSFNGTVLNADSGGAGQTISVSFSNGVATANLLLNKAGTQTIGFSIPGVLRDNLWCRCSL